MKRAPRVALAALRFALASLAFALLAFIVSPAAAEVERIDLIRAESFADGESFGETGAYRKLSGRIWFALDPDAPENARIVDLKLAARDDDGRVRFSADFFALRPVNERLGNGTLLVEAPNRGGKAMMRYFDRGAPASSDPTSAADAGDGFLLRRGFTLVWIGWQGDVPELRDRLRLYPVETAAAIEGLVRADHVFSEPATVFPLGHRDHIAYPVAKPEDSRTRLMVRDERLGQRRMIARNKWSFARDVNGELVADPRSVYYAEGFEPGKIYEVVYVVDQPVIVGLGLAAIRDAISYMKHDPASPVRGAHAIGFGISQTGRFMRHFLYQGFNADLEGRPVFDGVWAQTAGAGRGSFNHRFAQPSRDAHAFSAFFYPTDLFPFSGVTQRDPETRLEDGLFKVLSGTPAMPKIFFTNTGYDYWGRAAALIHTSLDGNSDLTLDPNERIYHFASTQHFVDRFPPQPWDTRFDANPADFLWHMRALLVALDDWVRRGIAPPPSRYPRNADGTLVAPDHTGFPKIRGVQVPRRPHQAYRANYGPRFLAEGIVDYEPPRLGNAFPVRVSRVDEDGNEVAGIRAPEIMVPLATYAPWNFRAERIGAPDEMADFRGSFIPFARTRLEAIAAHDPRRTIEERYASRDEYLGRFTIAAQDLIAERLLLAEDLPALIEHAGELWDLVVGPGGGE